MNIPTNAGELRRRIAVASPIELRDMMLSALRLYRLMDDEIRARFPVEAKALRQELQPVSVSLFAVEEGRA